MIIDNSNESNKKVFHKILSFLIGIAIIGLLIVLYVLQNIAGVNEKITLMHLEKEKNRLLKEQQELKINIEFLTSPERLGKIAKEKFHMQPLSGDKIYVVKLKK